MIANLIASLLVIAVVTLSSAQADPRRVPEARALLSEIDGSGPKAVLARLWGDQPLFDEVCDRIETGDSQWLEVARRLRAASDAAITLSLNFSVARALPVEPARVLALVDRGFLLADVCTSPYVEPEPGIAEAYEARALEALAGLGGTELGALAERCAAEVRLTSR